MQKGPATPSPTLALFSLLAQDLGHLLSFCSSSLPTSTHKARGLSPGSRPPEVAVTQAPHKPKGNVGNAMQGLDLGSRVAANEV